MLVWENLIKGEYAQYSNWHIWIKKIGIEHWDGCIGNSITGEFFIVESTSEESIKNYCREKTLNSCEHISIKKEDILAL